MTIVYVPKETAASEQRVAATPETVGRMARRGLKVRVQRGAGEGAFLSDRAYAEAGAEITEDAGDARLILRVSPPSPDEAGRIGRGVTLISFLFPARHLDSVRALAAAGASAFAMDLVPRISRAQKMDALSSQANVAGYKAVLLAANHLGRYFPLLMTAAGTVKPARVLVMGAGVAGLQAVATAKRLGAIVEATDIRPDVKEQVQSLGGRFLDVPGFTGEEGSGGYAKEASAEYAQRQAEVIRGRLPETDVVITTAQVPGSKAPVLLSREMTALLPAGAVVVDLAADQGGNCEPTEAGLTVTEKQVTFLGPVNLPATVSAHASELYARNVLQVVQHLTPDPEAGLPRTLVLDLEDEITTDALAVHAGQVRHRPTAEALGSEAP